MLCDSQFSLQEFAMRQVLILVLMEYALRFIMANNKGEMTVTS